MIMGESGSGKTTSMRNLDPKTTFYIDADGKGLSWKGWKEQYKEGTNYFRTDEPEKVIDTLIWLSKGNPNKPDDKKYAKYSTVIIDTLNGIMVGEEMRRAKEKNFDKWTDLASYVWTIVDYSNRLRDDLTVILIAHSETASDDNGIVDTHMRTSGRKLRKMIPESKMTTVLLADYVDGEYKFFTRKANSTCKTPMGAFKDETIDNDITLVIEALKEY